MKVIFLAVLAALAGGHASPVSADAAASARLDSLTLTLVDLNPSDGITPWISFRVDEWLGSSASASLVSTATVVSSDRGQGPFEAVQAEVAYEADWAKASFVSNGTGLGGTLTAAGAVTRKTTGPFPEPFAHQTFGAGVAASDYGRFTLSNNTLLLVTAQSSLEAAVTAAWRPYLDLGPERANAYGYMSLGGVGASGSGDQRSTATSRLEVVSESLIESTAPLGYDYGPASGSQSSFLAVSFVNLSGGELSGALRVSTGAEGSSPVPEPGRIWLTLAGLLTAGVVLRCKNG